MNTDTGIRELNIDEINMVTGADGLATCVTLCQTIAFAAGYPYFQTFTVCYNICS